jgi:hypothetical protein
MLYDADAAEPLFAKGRPPKHNLQQELEWARERLSLNGSRPWRLISARHKLGKTLFEIEETTPDGTRRLVGKLGKTERAQTLNYALNRLWNAGFRPPSRLTVTEPVACLSERGFILQERAPGEQALDLILRSPDQARSAAQDCAEWLAALHGTSVSATPRFDDPGAVTTWVKGLTDFLPHCSSILARIEDAVLRELIEPVRATVPCHGDFHAMNLFIHGHERLTGIDLDKFSRREREADAGYFLSQSASLGFMARGSFSVTEPARLAFVERYEAESGRRLNRRRTGLHMAMAFLKNLHFELVLLKTGRMQYVEPWLNGASRSMLEEDLYLT